MRNGSRIVIAFVIVGLVFATILVGCKGFWDLPSSTSTGGNTPTTLSSGVFYVLNQTAGQIVAYDISSGTLNKIGAYSVPGPTAIAVAPNGTFLCVSTLASGIYVYNIGSGGVLTIENNGQSISSELATAIAIDPSNTWLIDAFPTASNGLQVDAIPITTGGALDTGRTEQIPNDLPAFTNASANAIAISSDGKYVFVAAGLAGTVAIPFSSASADPLTTSSLRTITPVHNLGSDLSVAVDPMNRLFYIGETLADSSASTGGLRVFNYSSLSGTLTQVTGSPFTSGGLAPHAILPDTSGAYVYVANGTGNTSTGKIASFTISGSSPYTVASGNSISAGIQPMGLAEDSDSNFVLAVSSGGSTTSGNPDLQAYTMSSGTLTSALTSATGSDPVGAIAVAALP